MSKAMKLGQGNAIDKVCAIFSLLSERSPLRLSEISHSTGLHRVTALRILDALSANDFIQRSGNPPRYCFGPEVTAMAVASQLPDLRELVRPSLLRIADLSGDVALLSVRSGTEAICIDRMTGDYPISSRTLEVGTRRPLGIGAGSMALLAWAPPSEHDAIMEITLSRAAESYPRMTRHVILEQIQLARERGYVMLLDVVIEKLGGIACPICDPHGNVIAAISVTALRERIADRKDLLVRALKHEQDHIQKMLR
ncbi:IclR family transcriptional regulator [Alcaligenaceae bacterium]|nr:IclR family transcriptional regulator [Alcaligenaceae bacterium]